MIDIDTSKLPSKETVRDWNSEQFVSALRHDPKCPAFNPHLRQLLHVGYKVAAEMGDRYLRLLEACEPTISRNVTGNLYERHLKPLFVGEQRDERQGYEEIDLTPEQEAALDAAWDELRQEKPQGEA